MGSELTLLPQSDLRGAVRMPWLWLRNNRKTGTLRSYGSALRATGTSWVVTKIRDHALLTIGVIALQSVKNTLPEPMRQKRWLMARDQRTTYARMRLSKQSDAESGRSVDRARSVTERAYFCTRLNVSKVSRGCNKPSNKDQS